MRCLTWYTLFPLRVVCFLLHGVRYLDLDTAEFMMAAVMNSVVSQGMITSSKKGLQLFCDTPPEFKTMNVFGTRYTTAHHNTPLPPTRSAYGPLLAPWEYLLVPSLPTCSQHCPLQLFPGSIPLGHRRTAP